MQVSPYTASPIIVQPTTLVPYNLSTNIRYSQNAQSSEAEAIDYLRSEKFKKYMFDTETPSETWVSRFMDRVVSIILGKPIGQGAAKDGKMPTRRHKKVCMSSCCTEESCTDISRGIINCTAYRCENYLDLNANTTTFFVNKLFTSNMTMRVGDSAPISKAATETHLLGTCIDAFHFFDVPFHMGASQYAMLEWTLDLGENCTLQKQQYYCVERHLGYYFSSDVYTPDPYDMFIQNPSAKRTYVFTRPSKVKDLNWTITAWSGPEWSSPNLTLSPSFVKGIEERFESFMLCANSNPR